MDEWKSLSLTEVAEIVKCQVSPGEMTDEPYIGLEHIGQGSLNLIGVGNASQVVSNKFRFNQNDVLYGKLRPYFRKVIRAPCDGVCSTDIWVLRAKEGISSLYLFYLVADPLFTELANRSSEGTKMPRASWDFISSQSFPIPPIDEQRTVAHILGTLDDKIELNRRMNETLEGIARALFKSWFIDFDPVRAKAEGRQPFGMDQETAALFPSEFEDSELGEIPKGWMVKPLDDLATINGSVLNKEDPLEYIDYIEISQVNKGHVYTTSRYERGHEPSRARRRLQHGDTVLSTVRPDRGAYFLCLNPSPSLIASTGFAVVTPTAASWPFLYLTLTQQEIGEYLGRMADGGAYPSIRPEIIGNLGVILSPNEIINRFDSVVSKLLIQCHNNHQENNVLEIVKQALLPKLISGDIRVDPSKFGFGPEEEKVEEV